MIASSGREQDPLGGGDSNSEVGTATLAPDGRPLLPPRPNRGPELGPLDTRDSGLVAIAVLLLAGALVLGLVVGLVYRLRRSRRALRSSAGPALDDLAGLPPRERAIAAAELLRDAMNRRFGEAWAAKTTEELIGSPELAVAVGNAERESLIALLLAADEAKFAASESNGQSTDLDVVRALRDALNTRAGGVPAG